MGRRRPASVRPESTRSRRTPGTPRSPATGHGATLATESVEPFFDVGRVADLARLAVVDDRHPSFALAMDNIQYAVPEQAIKVVVGSVAIRRAAGAPPSGQAAAAGCRCAWSECGRWSVSWRSPHQRETNGAGFRRDSAGSMRSASRRRSTQTKVRSVARRSPRSLAGFSSRIGAFGRALRACHSSIRRAA